MPLPTSCTECAYFQREGALCRRHAPGSGFEEYELSRWPKIRKPEIERCGSSEAVGDGSEAPVRCSHCIHWLQPGGQGLTPEWRQGNSVEWWKDSGYCTRFAPSPSNEEDRETFSRVVHSAECCGDGEEVKRND